MYVPHHFEESRPERLHALIAQHPLGMLVTHGASGLDANHLPFEMEMREGVLGAWHTHVARANPTGATSLQAMRYWSSFEAQTHTSRPTGIRASTSSTVRCPRGTTSWRTRTDG